MPELITSQEVQRVRRGALSWMRRTFAAILADHSGRRSVLPTDMSKNKSHAQCVRNSFARAKQFNYD